MKRLSVIIIGLVLLFSLGGYAASSNSESFGSEGNMYSASSLGMGHTLILGYTGPGSIYTNPANLADSTELQVSLGSGLSLLTEYRSYPAYSFFDNLIGYQTYVSNQNVYPDFSFAVSKGFKFGAGTLAVGLAYLPVMDYNYDYLEEVRNEDDPEPMKIANNIIERTGSLNSVSLGFAYNFNKLFSLGLGFNMLSGTMEHRKAVIFTEKALATVPTDPGYSESGELEMQGSSVSVGANLYLKRFQFGVTYRTAPSVGKTYTYYENEVLMGDQDLNMTYPSSLGFGIQYLPRNGIWTKIKMEYEKIAWSEFEFSLGDNDPEDLELEDVEYYRLGIEHIFDNGSIMRVGFYNKNSYLDTQLRTVGFTGGTGIKVSDFLTVNVGLEVSKRKFNAEDLFADSLYADFYDFTDPVQDRETMDEVEQIQSEVRVSFVFTR